MDDLLTFLALILALFLIKKVTGFIFKLIIFLLTILFIFSKLKII